MSVIGPQVGDQVRSISGVGGGPYVSNHEARLAKCHGELPDIPDNVGSRDKPVMGLLGQPDMEAYRKSGWWFFRQPMSKWMPEAWMRSDSQDALSISYFRGIVNR